MTIVSIDAPPMIEPQSLYAFRLFDTIRDSDPRLMIVLAEGRINAALWAMLISDRGTDDDIPWRFRDRTEAAYESGLVDSDLREFMDTVRWMRNRIEHRRSETVLPWREPYASVIIRLCDLAGVDPVAADVPRDDLRRSIHAACWRGVMAAELRFDDDAGRLVPNGFAALRGYLRGDESPLPSLLNC